MKRFIVTLLITVLFIQPVSIYASEASAETTVLTTDTGVPTPANSPQNTQAEPQSAPDTITAEDDIPNDSSSLPSENNLNTDNEIQGDSPHSVVSDSSVDSTNTSTTENSETSDTTNSTDAEVIDDLSDEAIEDSTKDSHEHVFEYLPNGDGTHTKKCISHIHTFNEDGEEHETECDYEEIESCTLDENGKCIYCNYIVEKEKEAFNPSISFSISNQACTINESNPIVCLYISQEDYDIAYAQVCFANYAENNFINVGLAHGKYFDHQKNEFIYTSDDGWYASPSITSKYSVGDYKLRSVFVRSTTGDSIYRSLESDTLNEAYQEQTITVNEASNNILDSLVQLLPISNEEPAPEESSPEPVVESPTDEEIDETPEDETNEAEHEHKFEYVSNSDGTHTKKCLGHIKEISGDGEEIEVECDYEEIEDCTLDENGKCIYCDYVEEKEIIFKPSVSFSIANRNCVIGKDNPVISLNISQEDYDIAYAQVCFANYDNDNYINVGLTKGKYFDHKNANFVNTSDDNWYASPNITDSYAEGSYKLRSIYIRSANGESVYYSLESGTLDEEYQDNIITIINSSNDSIDGQLPPSIPDDSVPEDSTTEPIIESPTDEELEKEPVEAESVHEHEFEYISNGDGTHIKKCVGTLLTISEDGEEIETKCDYEEIEACSLDEDGKCIYCDFVEEKEKTFNPSIFFSVKNQTCTIGENNPVISLYISQEDFDIAYAQVCFANYDNNNYINVGLTKGKYFDHKQSSFVNTSDNNWYASPNITDSYAEGTYKLRSIYVRSTSGESIYHSLESKTLDESYQEQTLTLNKSTNGIIDSLIDLLPISEEDTTPEDSTTEPVIESPTDEELEEKPKYVESLHEHEFEYTSNGDGTHIKKCVGNILTISEEEDEIETKCDYEEIEACTLDDNGNCIYCDYEKEDEKVFEPSISFSAVNQTCTIGETNPIISLSISQADFDIAYAQVCFANYDKDNYINVGLTQGKYFDHKNASFVSTFDNNWYASPNITDSYAEGSYKLRSIYIRSTTGESVYYSIESNNLTDSYKNITLTLVNSSNSTYEEPLELKPDESIPQETPTEEQSSNDNTSSQDNEAPNDNYNQWMDFFKKLFGFG